jgi:hypothetical protein
MISSFNRISRREEVSKLFEQLGQVLEQRIEALLIGGAVTKYPFWPLNTMKNYERIRLVNGSAWLGCCSRFLAFFPLPSFQSRQAPSR